MAQVLYDWRHYLAVLQRKPGALRNGAPFAELPAAFNNASSQCSQNVLEETARLVDNRWRPVLHHDEQTVLCAVELAT